MYCKPGKQHSHQGFRAGDFNPSLIYQQPYGIEPPARWRVACFSAGVHYNTNEVCIRKNHEKLTHIRVAFSYREVKVVKSHVAVITPCLDR